MIGIGQGLRLLLLILARRDIHEKSHAPRTAMRRRARTRWRRSRGASGGSERRGAGWRLRRVPQQARRQQCPARAGPRGWHSFRSKPSVERRDLGGGFKRLEAANLVSKCLVKGAGSGYRLLYLPSPRSGR